jgi:ABC-2 type transport system ATP-binding protein
MTSGMTKPPSSPGIELRNLARSFGPVQAVRHIDLAITAGETVGLLGPNGAGKSTTIDLLLGLLRPDRGSVSVFGMTPAEAIAAGKVGAMLQTGALLRDLNVRELLTMMASLYPSPLDVDEVLALTGTTEIAGRRTQKLSGGQTQRVRFAIALVSNPSLLVLDEPTVGMDVEARHGFWTTMRAAAAQGKTVLFATHYLEEADAYADRIVLLSGGRVVADGPAGEIKARVGGRTIRATLAGVDARTLAALSGVTAAERRGDAVVLSCHDADVALAAFLRTFPAARDIEVRGAGLDEAFLELVGEAHDSNRLEATR